MTLPRWLSRFFQRRNARADFTRESQTIERLSAQYRRARKSHKARRHLADQMFNERTRRLRLQFGDRK
jgi:hypothetical protein